MNCLNCNQCHFRSDAKIAALTKSEILKKINDWGYSELYLAGRSIIDPDLLTQMTLAMPP